MSQLPNWPVRQKNLKLLRPPARGRTFILDSLQNIPSMIGEMLASSNAQAIRLSLTQRQDQWRLTVLEIGSPRIEGLPEPASEFPKIAQQYQAEEGMDFWAHSTGHFWVVNDPNCSTY